MHVIVTHVRLSILVVLLVATGCRTYGSQDSRVLLQESIDESISQVSREGVALSQDAEKLAGASELNSDLRVFADQAQALVESHRELVERLQTMGTNIAEVSVVTDNPGARWLGPDRYRELHRVLGSVIAERQHLMNQRTILTRDLGAALGLATTGHAVEEARYQIVPHHYHQLIRAPDLTDVLAQLGEAAVN